MRFRNVMLVTVIGFLANCCLILSLVTSVMPYPVKFIGEVLGMPGFIAMCFSYCMFDKSLVHDIPDWWPWKRWVWADQLRRNNRSRLRLVGKDES